MKFIKEEAPEGRAVQQPAISLAPLTPPAASAAAAAPAAKPTAAAPAAKEKTTSVSFNKDDFKNDPLIQKALEIFKGTIVEVRA
ncbi:MAG: hypothetical protein QM760_12645 [Nibricoccus sp.]